MKDTENGRREREALLEDIRLAEEALAAGKGIPHEIARQQLLERLGKRRSPE